MTLHYRHLLRCFSCYGRVSQHLPGGADMYSQHRRCQVAQPCVSPSPISRGGDCLHARHLLITHKAPLRHDATLPTPAPMFLVLRTRFATSACITMSTNPVRRKSSRHIDMCVLLSRALYCWRHEAHTSSHASHGC